MNPEFNSGSNLNESSLESSISECSECNGCSGCSESGAGNAKMKEVIAIIRPNKVSRTVKALEAVGFPAMTAMRCYGRGKQRGYLDATLPEDIDLEKIMEEGAKQGLQMKYIPKRLLSVVVEEADVPLVVGIIMKVNRTGKIGDGRIFVLPVEDAVRVRTGERGLNAL